MISGGSTKKDRRSKNFYTSEEDELDEDEVGQGERKWQADGNAGKMTTSEGWIWTYDESTEKTPVRSRVRNKGAPP